MSAGINGFARLGSPARSLTPEDLEPLKGSDTLEVVDVAVAHRQHWSFLGHNYFHADPWVSSDVLMLLTTGATCAERGLERSADDAFWGFPDDYAEIAPERARALYGR